MMCKRLTRAALFILCATLPLGISAAYQNAKDGDITAGNILWVQPSELSPNYRAVRLRTLLSLHTFTSV